MVLSSVAVEQVLIFKNQKIHSLRALTSWILERDLLLIK